MKSIQEHRKEFDELLINKMKTDEETREEVLTGLYQNTLFYGCDTIEDEIYKSFIEEELGIKQIV